MKQLVRFVINVEDKQRVDMEARKLGIESSDFLQLLIKAYFNGVRLEHRELASEVEQYK